jgi:putative oxidoreductase
MLLRAALGIVFIWYGILKIIGASPVDRIISATVYWLDPNLLVPAMGYTEIIIGLGFLFRKLLPFTFWLFLAQMAGTFLVLFIRPDMTFQNGNIFLLTNDGEFIIKNLILVAAGWTVYSKEIKCYKKPL